VRLVDDEQRRVAPPQPLDDRGIGQLLRCEQQELEPARLEVGQRGLAFAGGDRGIERGRREVELEQGLQLIPLERDQGRYHDGRPGHDLARNLVDRALATARRQQGQRVSSVGGRGDRLVLAGQQASMAQRPARGTADGGRIQGHAEGR
jgi:hypothetical protein